MKLEFKNNFSEDKENLRQAVSILKSIKVIKYDGDLAKELGYSRGAISEILNPKSIKKVSHSFMLKFKNRYDSDLEGKEIETERFKILQNQIDVLKQYYLELYHRTGSKKSLALLEAEFDKAVELKNSIE